MASTFSGDLLVATSSSGPRLVAHHVGRVNYELDKQIPIIIL